MIQCLKCPFCPKLNWRLLPETHSSWFSHLCHPPVGDVTPAQLTLHERMAGWLWPHTARFEERNVSPFVKCVWQAGASFVENVCCECSLASPTKGTEEGNGESSPVLPDQYVSCSGVSLQRWEAKQMKRKRIPVQLFNYGKVGKGNKTKQRGMCSWERKMHPETCSLLASKGPSPLVLQGGEHMCRISAMMGARLERGMGLVTGIPNKEDVLPTKWMNKRFER